jgi:dihydroxyacetone kinase-like protein
MTMTQAPATLLPNLIQAIDNTIQQNAEELTELDQAIGDGDHVSNLQRGIQAVTAKADELSQLDWQSALQKIAMTVMSSIGGASGSLYGTLFLALSKQLQNQPVNSSTFAEAFRLAVDAVKQRGKADKGEKTMLDVLIPVADYLSAETARGGELTATLSGIKQVALDGVEATRDMIATKGRASFLGERSKGHIDAGAKSSQLMICAVVDVYQKR